ncbi:2OG-Fe(II) oxygenase, partial [Hydrocoleum sp. CS-953]|uniref:2OG-Fe(II) oxygenase n=1 Tax=Hydrocoleum sp. CS-953 TaxID=1671698 RepID=UPI001FEFCF46
YQVINTGKINYYLIISHLMFIILLCTDALMQRPYPPPPTLPYGRTDALMQRPYPNLIKYSKVFDKWITAHNHGHYYQTHNDNGIPEVAKREITYVYYFYQQPQQFSGGELVLYDEKIDNNYYKQAN